METKIAHLGIIVEDNAIVDKIQTILSQYSDFIIGRMGIPYKPKNIRVISVVLDAPIDTINAISGKIGNIPNVKAKIVCSNV